MRHVEVKTLKWSEGALEVQMMIKNALFEIFGHADYRVTQEEISGNVFNEQPRVYNVVANRTCGSDLIENKIKREVIKFKFTCKNNSLRNVFLDCISKLRELEVVGGSSPHRKIVEEEILKDI